MNNPVHRIKRFVSFADNRPSYWTPAEAYGWLGSGIPDCYGNEIFEGDIVKSGCRKYTVTWERGALCVEHQALHIFGDGRLEIVGHIKEDTP